MRPLVVLLLAIFLTSSALAQDSTEVRTWSWDASAWAYIVPDDTDYLQPTVMADHDWLHLEGRYNYEALQTASFWAGYNFHAGSKLTLDVTPMAGFVVGEITGVAPGYELTLAWWKLELYGQAEYVIDFNDSAENFFYYWSQLGISPVDWLELGITVQRTRAYETERDVQRGFFGGVTWKALYGQVYVFNPDDTPTWILAVGATF